MRTRGLRLPPAPRPCAKAYLIRWCTARGDKNAVQIRNIHTYSRTRRHIHPHTHTQPVCARVCACVRAFLHTSTNSNPFQFWPEMLLPVTRVNSFFCCVVHGSALALSLPQHSTYPTYPHHTASRVCVRFGCDHERTGKAGLM